MSWVYFIRPVGAQGPVKIGCSELPHNRLKTFAQWSPLPLEFVAILDGDAVLERRFHAKFEGTYSHKEWFGWSQELEDTINAIKAGTFDPETLPDPEWVTLRDRPKSHYHGPRRRLAMLPDGSVGLVPFPAPTKVGETTA